MSRQNYGDWAEVAAPGMRYPSLTYSQWILYYRTPSTTRNWKTFLDDAKRCRLKRNRRIPWETESVFDFMERIGILDEEYPKNVKNGNCRM